ncbi:hypothetical protein H8959_002970 [Pygathrix nigripes]
MKISDSKMPYSLGLEQNCQAQKYLCTPGFQWTEEALDKDFRPCPAETRLEAIEAAGRPAQGWSCHEEAATL